MKINCLCGEEIESQMWFFHHMRAKHNWQDINMLYYLLEQIHIRIESLEHSDNGYDKMFYTEARDLLKSLLQKQEKFNVPSN